MLDEDDLFRRMRAGDGSAWRWRRSEDLLARGRRPDRLDDAATVAAWRFRRDVEHPPVVSG